MSFSNCTEAYTAGYANIPASSPHYSAKLDRDHDGIACDQPPPGFTPHKSEAGTATSSRLPQTGPGEVGAVGALVLVVGVAAVVLMRRRRTRFTAA